MNLKKIAALAIQFGLAYSYCNTVNNIYALDVCQDVGDSTFPNSAIFSCSATGGLLATVYEGNGCDGELWFDGAADLLFGDELSYNCGGETCEVGASITNYFETTDCTPTGASDTLLVPGGCIGDFGNLKDGYYAFTQCDGTTGGSGANVLLYDGPECTGNLVAVMAGETGCADDGTYEVFSCTGAGEVRDFNTSLVVDSFDDYEAKRGRQMTTRRPRRSTTRRPRSTSSTVSAVAANVFARAFPRLDLDKIVLVRVGAHKEEMVAQEGDWAQHGTKANVVMMIGVLALVAVMAVYFCAGRLMKKGKGLSEDSALLPAYGAVNA
mmetsp:Transcript_47850/g.79378  ORF Transcript_47850/g.79378 Transcript_47850/m.79378 type:complete len:324 (+) Transcript_47850:106-1077(+)